MLTLLRHRRKSFRAAAAADYRSTVLADNPLFYYRLGEASGTDAYDEVAATNNGTYYNTPTLGQTGAISGDSNTTVLFEQANAEYATTKTLSSVTSLLPCTIECFVKCSGASDDNGGIVFIRGTTPASGLNIIGSTLGKLGYHWRGISNTYSWTGGPTLSDNTWYYVALVVESTKATIYVIDESGTLTTATNSVTHSAINPSTDPWYIARDTYSARYFQGYIDEVAVYDQALSQSTLVAHAAAAGYTAAADYRSAVLADSPSAYWQLDESSGTTLADSVGSYDLTLTGSYSLNQSSLAGSSASVDFTGGHAAGANQGPNLSSTDYTMELVTKLDSTQPSWSGLISSGDHGNNWSVQRYSSTGDLRVYHGTSQVTFTGGFSSIADDSSHHVVITYTNSSKTVELWIDGVSQGTLTHAAHPTNNTGYTLRLAASRDPIATSGLFDEAAIYTSKLSDATISAHYAATGSPGTTNLLAWYEMNDASGGAVDSHSGSYDLTENGTPLYAQTGVNGNAIDFDGSTDYFSLASTFGWSEAYPFSFSAHFKTSSASTQTISQMTAPGAQGKYVLMSVQADGEVSGYVRDGTIQSIISSGAGVGDGAWHHLVATFVSATERYLYLDGVQVAGSASETSQGINTDMSEIRVGADQSNGISSYFDGLLDDVAFWSDELTLNEITWLYNSGSGRSYSAL